MLHHTSHHFAAGLLGFVSFALIAAAAPPQTAPQYPEPPAIIADRIADGRFEPGNFEYLRGYFPEASAAQKAQYAQLTAWLDACEKVGQARLDAELSELGIAPIENGLLRAPSACLQVVTGDPFEGFATYADLAEATRGARLVFDTLVQSVKRARERTGSAGSDDFASEIERRTMADQILRGGYRWGLGGVSTPRTPKMTAKERTVFMALLSSEIMRVDRDNTQWLKRQVIKNGWPRQSQVGKRAASGAWLITQHADLDPAFQRRALGLMEPLVAAGETSKIGYASLYDRNAKALNIKQRFGVQLICKDGVWMSHPLEDPAGVDERRAAMGLGPLADHIAGNSKPCP